jgi:hypothetical protein
VVDRTVFVRLIVFVRFIVFVRVVVIVRFIVIARLIIMLRVVIIRVVVVFVRVAIILEGDVAQFLVRLRIVRVSGAIPAISDATPIVLRKLVFEKLALKNLVLRDLVLRDLALRDLVLRNLVLRNLILRKLVLRKLALRDLSRRRGDSTRNVVFDEFRLDEVDLFNDRADRLILGDTGNVDGQRRHVLLLSGDRVTAQQRVEKDGDVIVVHDVVVIVFLAGRQDHVHVGRVRGEQTKVRGVDGTGLGENAVLRLVGGRVDTGIRRH